MKKMEIKESDENKTAVDMRVGKKEIMCWIR